jgi:hypothetical protein
MIWILTTSDREDFKLYMNIITEYVIAKFCDDFILSTVKGINLVDSKVLPQDVDARTEDDYIYISKSSVENCLQLINLEELESYLLNDISKMNDKFTFLIGNLYHELCHADAKVKMPILHSVIYDDESKNIHKVLTHYWIEFVVEYESHRVGIKTKDDLCISFINAKWNIKYFKFNHNDDNDMFWLIFTSSYFIGLCYATGKIDYYIEQCLDDILKDMIRELYDKSISLYEKMPFDDYTNITELESLLDKYWKRFIMRSRNIKNQ